MSSNMPDFEKDPFPISIDYGAKVFNFGKHRGKTIAQIHAQDPSYLKWFIQAEDDEGKFSAMREATKRFLGITTSFIPVDTKGPDSDEVSLEAFMKAVAEKKVEVSHDSFDFFVKNELRAYITRSDETQPFSDFVLTALQDAGKFGTWNQQSSDHRHTKYIITEKRYRYFMTMNLIRRVFTLDMVDELFPCT